MEALAVRHSPFPAETVLPFEGRLSAVFQPIVRVTQGRVAVALEALARGPVGTPFALPTAMFAEARRANALHRLDRLCIETAIETAAAAHASLPLFLNVHPDTLVNDHGFPAFLLGTALRHEIEPTRLTLEIIEDSRAEHLPCSSLLQACGTIRALGIRLAIDDVAGSVDARRAGALRPHIYKIDATVLHDARHSLWAREVLADIVGQALEGGREVIAEGVETERDLELAQEAGVSLMQGYLLGYPTSAARFGVGA